LDKRGLLSAAALGLLLITGCGGGSLTPTTTTTLSPVVTANPTPTPTPTVVTISPTTVVVVSGVAQQFSASVTGPPDQSVTWLVNGTAGGGSATGIISTSGVYSAPTTSSQLSVTVTARSNYDLTISANAAVTVTPQGSSSDLYIATNGSDSNACTQTTPCATFNHVDGIVQPGQTVHVMAGTYNLTSST